MPGLDCHAMPWHGVPHPGYRCMHATGFIAAAQRPPGTINTQRSLFASQPKAPQQEALIPLTPGKWPS